MAITVTMATYYTYQGYKGEIDVLADSLKAALMDGDYSFDRNKHKAFTAPTWTSGETVSLDDTRIPTDPNGYVYLCVSGENALTGSTEPTWPTTFGNTVVDNEAEWECWSYECAYNEISSSGEYTQQELVLSGENPIYGDGRSYIYFEDIIFTASGEYYDLSKACVIYDDSDSHKTMIVNIDFGTLLSVTPEKEMTLVDPTLERIGKETTKE